MDQDPAERAKGLTLMIGDEEGLMKLAISHARLDIRLEAVRFLQHRSSLAYVIMETKCSETRDIAIELQSKMA